MQGLLDLVGQHRVGTDREQALQYAEAIAAQQDGPLPLILCSNGHQHLGFAILTSGR